MKATASGSSRRSTRKTPRNTVSSPWVHKNQSNIVVSRGRPKASSKKSELSQKIYQKTATPKHALNPDIVKLQLALESPVLNGNGFSKRSSQRKKASLHRSLNEKDLGKVESGESPKIVTDEIEESEKSPIKKLNLDDEMEVDEKKESQNINGDKKEEAKVFVSKPMPNEDPKNWCLIL